MIPERRIGQMVVLAVVAPGLVVGELRAQEWDSGLAVQEVTLEEALSLAEVNAPALEQRLSQLEVAKYGELTAWGQFLPDLSLSYQYNNSSSGRLDPTGQAITTTETAAGGANSVVSGAVDINVSGTGSPNWVNIATSAASRP